MLPDSNGDDILDSTGYCLLSLDGGGVRGLATLYILQRTMKELNVKRKAKGLGPKKPCDIFDLMGGTSTGGWEIFLVYLLVHYPDIIQFDRNHARSFTNFG
jgi:patatin-like phospholipase/acyl hydrolase